MWIFSQLCDRMSKGNQRILSQRKGAELYEKKTKHNGIGGHLSDADCRGQTGSGSLASE